MGRILHAFQARHDWMPRLYSRAECRRYAATMIRRGWVTVALRFGRVAGLIALRMVKSTIRAVFSGLRVTVRAVVSVLRVTFGALAPT